MRVAHQRAADREHLLLAAREHTARIVGALAQGGEHVEHVVHRPAAGTPWVLHAEQQILAHGEGREDIAILGDVAQSLARDHVWR